MNEVVDWLRSVGYTILLEDGGCYSMADGVIIDATILLDRANRLRLAIGLGLFPRELDTSRHSNRRRHRGSLNLILGAL